MKYRALNIVATTLLHVVGVAFVTTLSLLATTGSSHAGLLVSSWAHPAFAADATKLLLQIGLSACVWAFLVIGYFYVRAGQKKRELTVIRRAVGTTTVETLIILVPYLLLTSGLAQLSQINVTGMLADVAIYDAARTVWLWEPELRTARRGAVSDPYAGSAAKNPIQGTKQLSYKAQVVAASILAPTAPGDFALKQTNGTKSAWEMFDHRAVMVGAFRPDAGISHWMISAGAPAWGNGGIFGPNLGTLDGDGDTNTLVGAIDTTSLFARAGRKITIAEWGMWQGGGSMEAIVGSRVGARMVYKNHIAFPWFGYIWGEKANIAGRTGYFGTIRRELTFPKQPDLD